MYLRRFRSNSVRGALAAVREALGPDALVLSTELVAAPGWRGWLGARLVEVTAAAERLEPSAARRSATGERHAHSDHADAVARLTAGGLEPSLADRVVASLPAKTRRGASLHDLRAALAAQLGQLAAADEGYARVEAFVGPPGVGKTTTIAKIAAQERARDGRRLGFVAADGFRIGAVEQLRTYAEILGAPFRVARTGEDLERELSGASRVPLLVDTAGRAPTDSSSRELFRVLASRADVRTHLVLAADTPAATARRVFDAYADARPSRLVLTKLDEAESLSPLVGLLHQRAIPISYLGMGQRVPEDLTRATARRLAASVVGDIEPGWCHA